MLSKEEVLKIAHLARLSLSEDEVTLFQQRLGRVLDYVKQLSELPTQDSTFVKHVPADAEPFRPDHAAAFGYPLDLLKNAPALDKEGFLLPAILENDG